MKSDQIPVKSPLLVEQRMLEDWRLLRCHLLWVYDRRIERTPRQWDYLPKPASAWLLRAGRIKFHFSDGEETFEAGHWVFPRLVPGDHEFSADAHLLSIRFEAEWPNGEHLFDRTKSLTIPENDVPTLTRASTALADFVRQNIPRVSQASTRATASLGEYLRLQPLFAEWISIYSDTLEARGMTTNTLGQFPVQMRAILSYLDSRSLSDPLRIGELASVAKMSSDSLRKMFVAAMKVTPAVYWNQRRLSAARILLSNGHESIKAVAYELGFSSPENFSHWFREQAQFSPSAYRILRQNAEAV